MEITIRKAKEEDFEAIFELIQSFSIFIKTPEKVKTNAAQMKADAAHFNCFVAMDNGKIIGFATYFFCYYSWSGRAIYLDDLYVLENYRGRGIGNKLFDKIIEIGKNKNCKKMRWQVSSWNEKAIDFYKLRGATINDVEMNCDLEI